MLRGLEDPESQRAAAQLHSCAPAQHWTKENSRQRLPQERSIDQTENIQKHMAANRREVYVSCSGRDAKLEKRAQRKSSTSMWLL
jgi:hypothetical protein